MPLRFASAHNFSNISSGTSLSLSVAITQSDSLLLSGQRSQNPVSQGRASHAR
jgi:hypothetical protein